MDCFTDCLRRGVWWVILGALVGAGLAVLLSFLLGCIALGGILGIAGGPAGAAIGIGIVCTGVGIALLPIIIVAAITGAIIGAILGFLAVAMWCGMECGIAASSSGATGIVGQAEIFPGSVIDCSTATAAVNSLEEQLSEAKATRDAQESVVESRRTAVAISRNASLVAMAALVAASFWNPLAAAAAAIAVAGSGATLAVALRNLVEAQVRLAELNARIAVLEATLIVAREVQNGLCANGGATRSDIPVVDSVGAIGTQVATVRELTN